MKKYYRCSSCDYVNGEDEIVNGECNNCQEKNKLKFVGYRYVAEIDVIIKRQRVIFAYNDSEALEKFHNKESEYCYDERRETEILQCISNEDE